MLRTGAPHTQGRGAELSSTFRFESRFSPLYFSHNQVNDVHAAGLDGGRLAASREFEEKNLETIIICKLACRPLALDVLAALVVLSSNMISSGV